MKHFERCKRVIVTRITYFQVFFFFFIFLRSITLVIFSSDRVDVFNPDYFVRDNINSRCLLHSAYANLYTTFLLKLHVSKTRLIAMH